MISSNNLYKVTKERKEIDKKEEDEEGLKTAFMLSRQSECVFCFFSVYQNKIFTWKKRKKKEMFEKLLTSR